MNKKLLFQHTLGHFVVDAACAAVVVSATHSIQFFVLYNFLAFCLQPLAGILLDKSKKIQTNHYILGSFILLLMGFIPFFGIWVRVISVGLGNCLFHTGAGKVILIKANKKMAPLGIFVASGAVGLLLGTMLAYYFVCHIALIISLLALILLNLDVVEKNKEVMSTSVHKTVASALCLCIAIRSFMGFMPLTQFEKTPLILIIITLGVFMGKSLGGFLCDKWGIRPVVIVSTILVMGLFLLSFQNPYLWTIVQIVVNLSMPITLYLMYKAMPQYPAFSFGLAASFLVVGLLGVLLLKGFLIPPASLLILFIINSGIILLSEKKLR